MMSGIVIFFFQGTDNLPYLVFRFDRVGFGDESAAIVFKEPFGNAEMLLKESGIMFPLFSMSSKLVKKQ